MKSKLDQLPDQNHIEQIRRRLWAGREFGQAAIMVGAGFSRNAERVSSSVPPFPLWGQLAERMFEALYPASKSDDKARIRATSGAGALKLASEFEELFGRQALDEMLLETIPDNYYQPGPLHQLMLSLPWSDVFTTNYDTLLERTRTTLYERKYDVILSPSDIPGRMKPRIVKLHGSFPSDRPFILTEEDYRTYPTRFAPLVNMVQQSIMENAFCLIGFSGDDPNFFYWTGWVRDHLGPATPPIYLCGLLDLSTPQRRLLESRGIRPIDFSPLFPEAELPDPQMRHSKAIEWFFRNLLEGAPPNVMNWPVSRGGASRRRNDLPAIPPGPRPLTGHGKKQPKSGTWENPDLKELLEIQEVWRRNRIEYPGWVLAPYHSREELWEYTAYWIEPVIRGAGRLASPDDLFLLYELSWRLEVTLSPLHASWANEIENVLLRYCPYPVAAGEFDEVFQKRYDRPRSSQDRALRPDEDKNLRWSEIRGRWVDLAFVLLRNAREDLKARFVPWLAVLGKIASERREWQTRWHHESCLFHLFCFDWEQLRRALAAWPEMLDVPFNETQRAAIMAEIGHLDEALRVAEAALAGIRSRYRPYFTDYTLLSQEGWTLALIELIKEGLGTGESFRAPQGDRWEKLQLYGCNPWPEIERMQLVLEGRTPDLRELPDPELAALSTQGNPYYIADLRPAFGFLRLFEEGALPIYCGSGSSFATSVLNAVRRVENLAPFWALSCMIRTSLEDEISDWFHTARIDGLMPDQVDTFFALFTNALIESVKQLVANLESALEEGSFTTRQIRILPKLLSRLCLRCNTEQRKYLLDLAVQIYNLQAFQQLDSLHACVNSLFGNLLSLAMEPVEIVQSLSILLDLPLPTESGFQVPSPEKWAEPFDFIQWPQGARLGAEFDRSDWTARIASLLSILRHGEPEARSRAARRLAKLDEIQGLSAEQREEFGRALWARTDPASGLPADTPFPPVHLPQLPGSRTVIQRTISGYIRSLLDPIRPAMLGEVMDEVLTLVLSSARRRGKRRWVDWTPHEDRLLIGRIESWWQSAAISNGSANEAEKAITTLVLIVGPRIPNPDSEIRQRAMMLFTALESVLPGRFSLATLRLFLHAASPDDVADSLLKGLKSRDALVAQQALAALSLWLEHGSGNSLPPPPSSLLNELIRKLYTCRPPLLPQVMEQLSCFLRRQPQTFDERHVERLLEALEFFVEETRVEHVLTGTGHMLIPERDRPRCREMAARLAYYLHDHLKRTQGRTPAVLSSWKQICRNDHLPQVRNAWPTPGRMRLVAR